MYVGRALVHKFKPVKLHRASSEPGICTPWRVRAKESLLTSSLTHHKMCNYIYTLTSQYNYPIWDIPFPLQFFNSMGLLWATISHSPINHFGHINIRNWSPHGGEQRLTLTRQKSLVGPTYFNAPKCHITTFMPTFPTIPHMNGNWVKTFYFDSEIVFNCWNLYRIGRCYPLNLFL